MVKSVDEEEMVLRIHALLRRGQIAHDKCLYVGNTIFDYDAVSITLEDERITLPQNEFLLLL